MNEKEVILYDCGVCNERYVSAFDARDCCSPCRVCGEARRGLQCNGRQCVEARRIKSRDESRARAKTVIGVIDAYEHPVFHPDMDGDLAFFVTIDDACETMEAEDAPETEFFWGSCKRTATLNADAILDNLVDDSPEMRERLVDWDWLDARISEWNAKQDACVYWENQDVVVLAMPLVPAQPSAVENTP